MDNVPVPFLTLIKSHWASLLLYSVERSKLTLPGVKERSPRLCLCWEMEGILKNFEAMF
jgi:hypothetical protein